MTVSAVSMAAHAKLNLFLRVLAREDTGYHGIETVFCLVNLADRLTAERRESHGVTIDVTSAGPGAPPDVGPPEHNLAVRAAQLVLEATGHRFGVHLTLEKRIPTRAGLGGGSSDAAAALHLVNRLAGDAVPRHELLQFAARIGSDVPYLFTGAPLALGWSRGERLLRLPALPSAPVLLVTPSASVSTAEAYAWVDQARQSAGRRGAVALDGDALSHWGDIGRMAGNDFESPAFARHAEIRTAFEALVGTRPLVCRMSGSGSTLFAIYRSPRDRDDAKMMLGKKYGIVTATDTLASPPRGPESTAA